MSEDSSEEKTTTPPVEDMSEDISSETPIEDMSEKNIEDISEDVSSETPIEDTSEENIGDLSEGLSKETPIDEDTSEENIEDISEDVEETRWYSLRVISGKERKIKERIELEIMRSKWGDFVKSILVPTEKVYKIRNGKKVISERNILPGYILVEALPSRFRGDIVQGIANIPNVIHFLGRNNPIPMQQSEANRMLGKVDESQNMEESLIEPFIVGETIKIIDGPFTDFVGDIQEVNEEKKKLKVIVKIFGRGTEVELTFMQVDKQS